MSPRSGRNALVVMAKYPEVGQVKTRLGLSIGLPAAALLYEAFLRDLDGRLSAAGRPWVLHWAYTPADARFSGIVRSGRPCLAQRGGDLGERLYNVYRDVSASGFGKVVVIGSDSPYLPIAWLRHAFAALDRVDAVLGPADDGGYYLLGLRRPHDLFTGIAWSTASVLQETRQLAGQLGLTTEMLPVTFDVDDEQGLAQLRRWLASARPDELPHTRAVLSRLAPPALLPYPRVSSRFGQYWSLTPEQVEREKGLYHQVTQQAMPADPRARGHMRLVTEVAAVIVERLRVDLGLDLSDISIVAAERHDVCRTPQRIYRLRPYGHDAAGTPPVRHDGHETRLARAVRKAGAPAIASVLRRHNVVHALYPELRTVDANVLLIADAMVEGNAIVAIAVRREAVAARYADADPRLLTAFRRAYGVVEATLSLYCQSGLNRQLLHKRLGIGNFVVAIGEPAARATDETWKQAPWPESLYIEVTNRCNSRCSTCPRTFYPPARERDLSATEFRRIVAQAPGLRRVVLHGLGEPLLNPALPEMVSYLREKGIRSVFNSNALQLGPEQQEALVLAGLDEYRVSLDGADEESYRHVREVDGFQNAGRNLAGLRQTKRRMRSERPRVSLWFTAMRDNLTQLPGLVRLAAALDIEEVYVQRLVYFGQGLATASQSLHGQLEEEDGPNIILHSQQLATQLGVALHASGATDPITSFAGTEGRRHWASCRRPWSSAYITVAGDVLPCCFAPFVMRDCSPVTMGNVFRQTLAEIWNGEAYAEFRRAFRDGQPLPCRLGCGSKWSV